jgi:hypothetical protein
MLSSLSDGVLTLWCHKLSASAPNASDTEMSCCVNTHFFVLRVRMGCRVACHSLQHIGM